MRGREGEERERGNERGEKERWGGGREREENPQRLLGYNEG